MLDSSISSKLFFLWFSKDHLLKVYSFPNYIHTCITCQRQKGKNHQMPHLPTKSSSSVKPPEVKFQESIMRNFKNLQYNWYSIQKILNTTYKMSFARRAVFSSTYAEHFLACPHFPRDMWWRQTCIASRMRSYDFCTDMFY